MCVWNKAARLWTVSHTHRYSLRALSTVRTPFSVCSPVSPWEDTFSHVGASASPSTQHGLSLAKGMAVQLG